MTHTTAQSKTFAIDLLEEERAEVLNLLEQALGETRIEVHRTHTPDYRDKVLHREIILRSLIQKFAAIREREERRTRLSHRRARGVELPRPSVSLPIPISLITRTDYLGESCTCARLARWSDTLAHQFFGNLHFTPGPSQSLSDHEQHSRNRFPTHDDATTIEFRADRPVRVQSHR